MDVEADPVGVQKRTVSHFKGLFKTFKMRYSTSLYSYWIGLHDHFKKAILHLKTANGRILFRLTVHIMKLDAFFNPILPGLWNDVLTWGGGLIIPAVF